MKSKQSYVYLLTNKINTVIYTGVTADLIRRVYQHKIKTPDSFTAKYYIDKLVYYEIYEDILEAINREKQIKAGSRKKKIVLIESINPKWEDLYKTLL